MRFTILIWLAAFGFLHGLFGQDATPNDLDRLRQQLRDAIGGGRLAEASEIAVKLDDGVQRQYRTWLARDSNQRVNRVMSWLPIETEALFVLQYPVVIEAQESGEALRSGPAQSYAIERLRALNNGDIYRRLQDRTIQLTVAAIRTVKNGSGESRIVPALMPDEDVTYFYFFTESLGGDLLGEPNITTNLGDVWQGTARVDAGEPPAPNQRERAQREDQNWLALPQPNLLVLCSRRETLTKLLQSIRGGVTDIARQAFPESMPVWAQVDKKSAFWGLRRYTDSGDSGLAVDFDVDSGQLAMRCLGSSARCSTTDFGMTQQFKTTHTQDGIWQFESSLRERGDFPFHAALALLGFGMYR
ncbi:MAG: hypothetical protein WA324_25060 [Bryobacteraceae bacterium]